MGRETPSGTNRVLSREPPELGRTIYHANDIATYLARLGRRNHIHKNVNRYRAQGRGIELKATDLSRTAYPDVEMSYHQIPGPIKPSVSLDKRSRNSMSRGLRNYAAQAAEYYGKTAIESVVLTTPKRILIPMHAPLALNVCMWMRACAKIGTRHKYVGKLVQYSTLMILYVFRTKHEETMADDHGRLSLHDRRRRQQAQNTDRSRVR